MRVFLKYCFRILATLVLAVVLVVVGIVSFVDPNQFKESIEREVSRQTGYQLAINGPLSWKWFPKLSLVIEEAKLANNPPFKSSFISINKAKAELQIWSLFLGKLFLNINLEQPTLLLEKNTPTENNWSLLLKKLTPNSTKKSTRLLLNGLQITNGTAYYHDSSKNHRYTLEHINLTANNLLRGVIGSSNPIALDFQLIERKKVLGDFILSGEWFLAHASGSVSLQNIAFKMDPPDGKPIKFNGELNLQTTQGKLAVSGALRSKYLNIASLLTQLNLSKKTPTIIPPPLGVTIAFHYSDPKLYISSFKFDMKKNGVLEGNLTTELSQQPLRLHTLKGRFFSKHLAFNHLYFNNIDGIFQANNDLIQISPFTFNIEKSPQHVSLKINLQEKQPHFVFTQQGDPFEIKNIITLFEPSSRIEGQTTLKLDLTTRGNTSEALKQNLAGFGEIDIVDGQINQIDLPKLLQQSLATLHNLLESVLNKNNGNSNSLLKDDLANWKSMSFDPSALTPFNEFKASFNITHGTITNQDLFITHNDYVITGEGTLNLTDNTLNYRTKALLKNNPYPEDDQIANYLYQTPLSIKIRGPLFAPSVQPDLNSYFNESMVFVQQNVIEKLIHRSVDKALKQLIKTY